MGKNNLILGTARGKLGDVVFYRTGGEQRFRTRVRPTNPRTNAQLLQRCVVSTAVKFYSEIAEICNHAFQNAEGSLKNHQRYMKLNIDYLRKIALKNIESWSPIKFTSQNYGNFTWKDSMEVAINRYQISEGDLPSVSATLVQAQGKNTIQIGNVINKSWETITYNDIVENLGLKLGDQLTFFEFNCYLNTGYVEKTYYGRVILAPDDGDGTKIYSTNKNKENNGDITIDIRGDDGENTSRMKLKNIVKNTREVNEQTTAWAVIVSRYENGRWRRNNAYVEAEEQLLNKQTLLSAMISYEKDTTSSLYLNQASKDNENNNEWTDVRPRSIEGDEEDITVKQKKEKKTAE